MDRVRVAAAPGAVAVPWTRLRYALAGALSDLHWNRLDPALKARLRAAAAAGYKRSRKA